MRNLLLAGANVQVHKQLLLAVQVGKEMMVRNLLLAGANVQVHKQLLSYLET